MKYHQLREGMIFEFLQRKTEPDDIERFWEIIEIEERQMVQGEGTLRIARGRSACR